MLTSRLRALLRPIARQLAPRPPALPRSYTDDELVRRTEEFNLAAESYWQEIAQDPGARRQNSNRPLSTVQDTPGTLYRLGLMLQALDLGVGLTVLDFGAGGCWLSSMLNRLGCHTIAMDVSQTALDLGQAMFALDPRHNLALEPRFLPYDGHRLNLPDASVDRVAMFDAFHHVPNQVEVLAEIFRVLRPGGRAVFAEPGEGHSHSDQSVFETETTGVLENDLEVEDVARKARAAGFTRVALKPYPAPDLELEASDYTRLIDGADSAFPMHRVRGDLRHFFIFILHKGEARHDSRNPRTLRARIERLDAGGALAGRAAARVELRLRVTNTGDTLWLAEPRPAGGHVGLGGHLFDADKKLVARGHFRAALPHDVAPGQSLELTSELWLPAEPGRYTLRLDLVDEGVTWFAQQGSPTIDVTLDVGDFLDSREPHRLCADLEPPDPTTLCAERPGAALSFALGVRNTGDTRWLTHSADGRGVVSIGAHLLAEDGRLLEWDFFRQPIERDTRPHERFTTSCTFAAPEEPGQYRLRVDLLADQVGWFESWGSLPIELRLEVGAGQADSTAPARLRAQLGLPHAQLEVAAGEAVTLTVTLRNTGNTLWLAQGRQGTGRVALGAHLLDAQAALLEQDFARATLPADVAPGSEARATLAFDAPRQPGEYIVEVDLLVEGLVWFGSKGSITARLALRVRA
jgi:SAM-dependent methyltransferase